MHVPGAVYTYAQADIMTFEKDTPLLVDESCVCLNTVSDSMVKGVSVKDLKCCFVEIESGRQRFATVPKDYEPISDLWHTF
jgi:hypothetical protein